MKVARHFLMLMLVYHTASAVSIEEAFKKGHISYHITGADGYYGKCVSITVENKLSAPIKLEIETGRVLQSLDTNVQDMIVTGSFYAYLYGKQKITQMLYAMCAKQDAVPPDEANEFSHGAMATGNLLAMAKFIESRKLQDHTGQQLIWKSVKEEVALSECDYQPALYASLKTAFASNKNVRFIDCSNGPAGSNGTSPRKRIKTYNCTIGFTAPYGATIEISLFNSTGRKVKQILKQEKRNDQYIEIDYIFTSEGLTEGETYEVRLLVNGKVKQTMALED